MKYYSTRPSFVFAFAVPVIAVPSVTAGIAPLLQDNVAIRYELRGRSDVSARFWTDSYSVGDSCYCTTTFDHDIDEMVVETPLGRNMTIRQVCDLLGNGPGKEGRPLYNDIQCGNGPANDAGDEDDCPGRTEYGQEGCKYIGPKWNFAPFPSAPVVVVHTSTTAPMMTMTTTTTTKPPTRAPVRVPTSKAPIRPPTTTTTATRVPVNIVVATPTRAPVTNTANQNVTCGGVLQLDLWDGGRVDRLMIPNWMTNITTTTTICSTLEMSVDAKIDTKCLSTVKFTVTGTNTSNTTTTTTSPIYKHVRNEYNPPYFLYGNSGTAVLGTKLPIGSYTVVVTPNGRTMYTKTVQFQVIACP